MSINIVVDTAPKEQDVNTVFDGLKAYNNLFVKHVEKKELGIFLKDDDKTVGGIVSYYYAQWMYIDTLWVDAQYRVKGYGKKLIIQAEAKAKELGVKTILVDTFSFQAPEFYEKNGYEKWTKLKDNPVKVMTRYYYKKQLQ